MRPTGFALALALVGWRPPGRRDGFRTARRGRFRTASCCWWGGMLGPMRKRTETVAVLMTDIEGSTAMLRDLDEDYAPLLEAHHRVVRTAAAQAEGTEVGNAGDGLAFIFPTAARAAAAAMGLQ